MPRSRRLDRALRLARNLLLYPVAALWPRSRRRWVFGHAGDQFLGNPKYLFLWMRLHRPDLAATWITGSARTRAMLERNGLPVAPRWSWAGIRAALGAGVFAFSHDPDDVNAALSQGARHLNLWHGVGVKALHLGAKPATGVKARLRSFLYLPYDIVVSTSPMMQAHFARQFRIPPERCPQLGYPRLDVATDPALAALARDIDRREGFKLNPDGRREVYLYVPTFRDTGRRFLADALPDLDALEAALHARDALLYIKLHPRTDDAVPPCRALIRRWPEEIDFQTYLPDMTGLITDYSSVLYDYLAVKRDGAILYTFDFERYVATDRMLAHDFIENVAGLRVNSFAELCAAIRHGSALATESPEVDRLYELFWAGSARPASAAVVEFAEGLPDGSERDER